MVSTQALINCTGVLTLKLFWQIRMLLLLLCGLGILTKFLEEGWGGVLGWGGLVWGGVTLNVYNIICLLKYDNLC